MHGSTSKWNRQGLRAQKRCIALAACAAVAAAGCAEHPAAAPKPVASGYVDLNALARVSPDWRRVAVYDHLIAALPQPEGSVRAQRTSSHGGERSITLSPSGRESVGPLLKTAAIPAAILPASGHTDLALQVERKKLVDVRNHQIAELEARLRESRDRQLQIDSYGWLRDEAAAYDESAAGIDAKYEAEVDAVVMANESATTNAQLRIVAMKSLLSPWSAALDAATSEETIDKLPPGAASAVRQYRADVAELAAAAQTAQTAFDRLDADRAADLFAAKQASDQSVADARSTTAAEMQAKDADRVAEENERLEEGMGSLLSAAANAENNVWFKSAAPGPVAFAYRWPTDDAAATASVVAATRNQLLAERSRWIEHVLTTTRVAALDVAEQRHWQIAFAPSAGFGQNLTAPISRTLTATVWKAHM